MTTGYDTSPDPAFASDVLRFPWQVWTQNETQLGWVAAGDCPHCGHLMAVYRRRVRDAAAPAVITATCNCVEAHSGRPGGIRQGCGQSAVVDLSTWQTPIAPERDP